MDPRVKRGGDGGGCDRVVADLANLRANLMHLVRHHSHWGAFLAEVDDGRIVGVRPFERDPDPSRLIDAIPQSVYSPSRIAQPMVREGWLKHGRGPSEARGREAFVAV